MGSSSIFYAFIGEEEHTIEIKNGELVCNSVNSYYLSAIKEAFKKNKIKTTINPNG